MTFNKKRAFVRRILLFATVVLSVTCLFAWYSVAQNLKKSCLGENFSDLEWEVIEQGGVWSISNVPWMIAYITNDDFHTWESVHVNGHRFKVEDLSDSEKSAIPSVITKLLPAEIMRVLHDSGEITFYFSIEYSGMRKVYFWVYRI